MNLLEIRKQFLKQCGRYDLVDHVTFADMGADFYINTGLRLLDRHRTLEEHRAVSHYVVKAGQHLVPLPPFSTIHEVKWFDGEKRGYTLCRLPVSKLSRTFQDFGLPQSYDIALTKSLPEVDDMKGTTRMELPNHLVESTYRVFDVGTIKLYPRPSRKGALLVDGDFYSKPLVEDTDVNVWTMRHPDLVVSAALWALEVTYRNTEGANDWAAYVLGQVREIEQKQLEQDVSLPLRMEG